MSLPIGYLQDREMIDIEQYINEKLHINKDVKDVKDNVYDTVMSSKENEISFEEYPFNIQINRKWYTITKVTKNPGAQGNEFVLFDKNGKVCGMTPIGFTRLFKNFEGAWVTVQDFESQKYASYYRGSRYKKQ